MKVSKLLTVQNISRELE